MRSTDITSKNLDGITDLVVMAPIKEDFITAYENITYASRATIVAEALNKIRKSAREHERISPYSDTVERILTLLDFRIGVIDYDIFALVSKKPDKYEVNPDTSSRLALKNQRYIYLSATFDGAWEPYMRLIWDPLGAFLDLVFCNCEGYVTAVDHDFEEYAQWVRDNQVDSAIFYSTTGQTVRDQIYLANLERLQRQGASDRLLAETTMPQPEELAAATRANRKLLFKAAELGLEALTALYRLADYYPPDWLTGHKDMRDGRYLARATAILLRGWDEILQTMSSLPTGSVSAARWKILSENFAEPLGWYRSGQAHVTVLNDERRAAFRPDPAFEPDEVQGGILPPGAAVPRPLAGAALLFTIRDAARTRSFIKDLPIYFAAGAGSEPVNGIFRNIAFTANGLDWIGVKPSVLDLFPKEFRDGMAARSGLIGDMRENHPRNWILPARNGPELMELVPPGTPLPAVDLSEVDFIIQLRSLSVESAPLLAEIRRLANLAAPGATLEAYDLLEVADRGQGAVPRDHFGFSDGISQPQPVTATPPPGALDTVPLGEILLGYHNERDESAPRDFVTLSPRRTAARRAALALQKDGSFLVVRKIEQCVDAFDAFISAACADINAQHGHLGTPMTEDRLKARILGRWPNGTPLVHAGPGGPNDFDYKADDEGHGCPFAAHIRRANPRDDFLGRPAPRIMRRGMSFDHRDAAGKGPRGLMFMCYNASIAEQYEAIQRWLNGGNSTFVSSAQNDPLTGVLPRTGTAVFRFIEKSAAGDDIVIRVTLPEVTAATPLQQDEALDDTDDTPLSEPGRHPFAPLHWGVYLFVPSRSAIAALCALTRGRRPMRNFRERQGAQVIERLEALDREQSGIEWKRLLEDFTAKDPSERNLSPQMWAAIRWYKGGSIKVRASLPAGPYNWEKPDRKNQNLVLCASRGHVRQVLSDWKNFTTEEQLRRIAPNAGPIYVAQQPDDKYHNPQLNARKLNYKAESGATNVILMATTEAQGFEAGYKAGAEVLKIARERARLLGLPYYKLELRRQYLLPALGIMCKLLYGLPDQVCMALAGWSWEPAGERMARCPGDFLSPSRNAFYPRPSSTVELFATDQGKAILAASHAFVEKHRELDNGAQTGPIAAAMFRKIQSNEVLARNLIGTMIGALPPMDGHLRGILLEWLVEQTLWRHQAALKRALHGRPALVDFAAARGALFGPVSQAMCKRPAPDLIYRTAQADTVLHAANRKGLVTQDVAVAKGDLVVVSLVSAGQRSLTDGRTPDGELSYVFGGKRNPAGTYDPTDMEYQVHACPAQALATGAIMGILAALLDAGRIQALPGSLMIRVSDWPPAPPPPG